MTTSGMPIPPDTAYYVVAEYFRRYKDDPLIIATVTSPVFVFNDYILSNLFVDKPSFSVSTTRETIHIQTENYPCPTQIYTIAGKLVKNMLLNENETAISVPAGIYVVVVDDEVRKVVVE